MDNLIKISDLQAFENAIKGNAMLVFSTTWRKQDDAQRHCRCR